jgi:hypothetical protein
MAKELLGSELKVYVDSSIWAYASKFSYNLTSDFTETNQGLSEGAYKHFLPTAKSWTGQADSLLIRTANDTSIGFSKFWTAFNTNASVGIKFTPDITGNQEFSGAAFIQSIDVNDGGKNEIASYSVKFQGTGTYTFNVK